MSKRVVIVGGGIIGLSCAKYLSEAGHKVIILDKGDFTSGCSFGNAGMIVPSHIIPLAAPGMIAKGIRWMFDSKSPFYIKLKPDIDLFRWGWQFYKHSNERHVASASVALKELSLLSKSEYQKWAQELAFSFGYHERGLLMLYQSKEAQHEESQTAALANNLGIEARILGAEDVQQLEPDVKLNVRGGVYFSGDAHLTPQVLFRGLHEKLKADGVEFIGGQQTKKFITQNGQITKVITATRDFECDELIISAGSWSGQLAKLLDLNLPMQAGKGYSFTLRTAEKKICMPSILTEGRVAATPMGSDLRLGGTMEITGIDHSININRVRGIVETVNRFYPELKIGLPSKPEIWHGFRPCSPDGLPYIGRTNKFSNVIIATGHAMMGQSLAPATGKIVSHLTDNLLPEVVTKYFDPDRFA